MTTPTVKTHGLSDLLRFDFFTERGIIGGLYLTALAVGLVLGHSNPVIEPAVLAWISGILLILGLIVSHVTYELLLTLSRWLTEPIVLSIFHKTVGGNVKERFPHYRDLREFRESFLASDGPGHLKSRIQKDERLRQVLTYLYSASTAAFLMIRYAAQLSMVSTLVISAETWLVEYVFVATVLGQVARSASFGRAIGIAYLYEQKTASGKGTTQ